MKNVLIITFFFNQPENIATVRLRGLVKYLPEFGWNPVVLTAETSAIPDKTINVFPTPYEDTVVVWKKRIGIPLNKTVNTWNHFPPPDKQKKRFIDVVIDIWSEIFTYPDRTISWSVSAIKKGDELLKEQHFDALVSSMKPPTSHIIAKELAKRKKIPWIADFRDLWTQNHYFKYSKIRGFFEKRLELDTLSSANALVTISHPFSEKLQELHKNKKVYTITNGFDPELVNPGIPLTKKFSITYTGYIYSGRQDPEPLFRVLKILIDEKTIDPATVEVHFFGDREEWLIRDSKKYQLESVVQVHGQISREESLQKQRESQVLLLLTWNDPGEKGVYTGKLFDYLAARRPILALGIHGSVVTDVLSQTHAGSMVSSDAEIKEQILTLYREYKEKGWVSYSGVPSEINTYSHREMARKFAEVLESVCEPGGNSNS
jgi:hypothetical protein